MRYRISNKQTSRAGLTLVEMLIALALSIFIMAILSEAFVKGLEAFGQYKALADLEQRLRTFANIIRRDLKAPHFDGSKKLSECTFSGKPMPVLDGLRANVYNATEGTALLRQLRPYQFQIPSQGFFSIEENPNRPAGATMAFEGQDSFGRPSYRDQASFDGAGNISRLSDVLHFSSRLEGNEPDKYFYGKVRQANWTFGSGVAMPLDVAGQSFGLTRYDNNTIDTSVSPTVVRGSALYTSQAAELLYFLGADGSQFTPGVSTPTGPVLTFNLYRQAWLLTPDQFSNAVTTQLGDSSYTGNPANYRLENDVSAFQDGSNNFWYNSMGSVQHRLRRVSSRTPRVLATGAGDGSDIMLTNVISFDVKVFDPFAYKIPLGAIGGGPVSGRGAYVDIGDVVQTAPAPAGVNPCPTAAGVVGDGLQPLFGSSVNNIAGVAEIFDTGTTRFEGDPAGGNFIPAQSPATHAFPFTSIQITIRVYEPKSRQTRQITIIQDM